MKKLSFGMALVVAFVSFGSRTAAEIGEVDVTGGRVAGVSANGIVSFKGIPFAAPPVHSLRWKAPQSIEKWAGVKQASAYAPSCMQDSDFMKVFGAGSAISEDCLYLNVWTPAKTANDRLPVMVWIYGGGFVFGMTGSPVYDGTHLAEKRVVIVSVAYRVGVFGFLADPELSRENGGTSGNYGLEDMVAGLEWVKSNISRFGGDPSRVTIFGESAGGSAVNMLAVSPAAKGLFQRAISESGGCMAPPLIGNEGGESVPSLKVAEAFGHAFLAKLGVDNTKAARALDAEKIQTAIGPGLQGGFGPVFDGKILPGDEYKLYRAGRFNDTPVLVGTNSDEGALFARPGVTAALFEKEIRDGYGTHADAILAAYPHGTDAAAAKASNDLIRDSIAWHTWAWAMLQSEKGKGKAYVYYFDHRTPQSPNGATHGSEMAYVFHNLGPGGRVNVLAAPTIPLDIAIAKALTAPARPEDIAMADLLGTYWTNFAKNADPNGPALPSWPAFTAAGQRVMMLDAHPSARPMPNMKQIKALDSYYAWRRDEAKSSKGN